MSRRHPARMLIALFARPWAWLRGGARRLLLAGIAFLALVAGVTAGVYLVVAGDGGAEPAVEAPPPTPTTAPDWETLQLPEIEDRYVLTASRFDAGGVAVDTSFVLEASDDARLDDLESRLLVDPPAALRLDDVSAQRATISPREPLAEGEVYRFTLLDEPQGVPSRVWAFQVQRPVRVVQTLPRDQATDVPLDTGIELTFSHEGITGFDDGFRIEPPVGGRFETHKRTTVFVPRRPLSPFTLYTVTLAAEVGLAGTDRTLGEDFVFQFETGSEERGETPTPSIQLARAVFEAPPGEPPVLSLYRLYWGPDEASVTEPVSFAVYRFPDVDAFLESVARFDHVPSWATRSRARYRDEVSGLERVAVFDATPQSVGDYGDLFVSFPEPLPEGYYLVQARRAEGGSVDLHLQGWLQVTDVATYASIGLANSLLWVNDVSSGAPIEGARVRGARATLDATTGADGVAFFETPEDLVALEPSPFGYGTRSVIDNLLVEAPDGRTAVVPLGNVFSGFRYFGYRAYTYPGDPSRYWRFLYTDRHLYRPTDAIRYWGLVRAREDAPASQELTVQITGGRSFDSYYGPAVVAEQTVTASARGTFIGELSFEGVSTGFYSLEVRAGEQVVASTYLEVRDFVKPAYKIDVAPDRKAIVSGETVSFDISAAFFEGSPVPNLDLKYSGITTGELTTDAAGRATVAAAPSSGETYWYDSRSLSVVPKLAEEGDISGSAWVQVFPSTVTFSDMETEFRDGQAVIEGQLVTVDLDRINSEKAEHPGDYLGEPVPGSRVEAHVDEVTYERIQTGEYYDFIAKLVRPQYRYEERRRPLLDLHATTDADGRFVLSFPGSEDVSYDVRISAADDAGRRIVRSTGIYGRYRGYFSEQPYLVAIGRHTDPFGFGPSSLYDLGEEVRLAARLGPDDLPSGGPNRYLFYTAQNGLRDYQVQGTSQLSFRFNEEHVPSVHVVGVRFTGATYQEVGYGYTARVNPEERRLTLRVEPDRERYEPGDEATINLSVTDPDGNGVRAEVLLSAVDEAIFRLEQPGFSSERDILEQLYEPVSPGILSTYASHQYPAPTAAAERGGDGGPRADFKDVALFETVTTGSDGRGSLTFKLPDNLTSWRVTALAVSDNLYAGQSLSLVPVGLPFFVDVVLNRDYLTSDEPMLRVRAFGEELQPGDAVSFTVSAPTLGRPEPLIGRGFAFQPVDIPLPSLVEGSHDIIIEGTDGRLSDSLQRTVRVLPSRLVRAEAWFAELAAGLELEGAADRPTRVVFSDHNRGRYLPVLRSLSWTYGDRVDQMLARALSQELLATQFEEETLAPPVEFDGSLYQTPEGGGIALFPYADDDLTLSARVAAVAPTRFGRQSLAAYFRAIYDDEDETRERVIIALYGLAALGEPVLPDVRAVAATADLAWRERLYVGLAAQELGDEETARGLERRLLEEFGQRRGPSVRLRVGVDQDDILEATSLAAILAAGIGDSLAPDLFEYALRNYTTDILVELEQISFLVNVLPRLSPQPVRFAYTLDGERQEAELERGRSLALLLSPEELAALQPEPLEGRVGVATSYLAPLDPATVERDVDVAISRRYLSADGTPATFQEGELVRVVLDHWLGPQAMDGCYQVSDLLPSGLKAVTRLGGWGVSGQDVAYPYATEGQRVSFCVYRSARQRPIAYYARVTGRGEFDAEPAIIQSQKAPESINLTTSQRVVIP